MKGFNAFVGTMLFYMVLSYVIMPLVFYYFVDNTLMSAGNGNVVGSLMSVVLWYTFRSQII